MAIEVTGLVLRAQLGLGSQAKMVLLGLADHAGADGTEARPGVKTLAQYAECSTRTVQRHLGVLVDEGFIEPQRKAVPRTKGRSHGGVPTVYRIVLSRLATLQPSRGDALSPQGPRVQPSPQVSDTDGQPVTPDSDNVSPLPPRGDISDRPGATNPAPRGDTAVSPEPSLLQPSKEPSKNSAAAPRDRDEVWDDLTEIFGSPVNDADSSRRERAAKLCRQAGWVEGELAGLRAFADRDSRAWVTSLAATDMALAVNVGRLRALSAAAATDDESAIIERVLSRARAAGAAV